MVLVASKPANLRQIHLPGRSHFTKRSGKDVYRKRNQVYTKEDNFTCINEPFLFHQGTLFFTQPFHYGTT